MPVPSDDSPAFVSARVPSLSEITDIIGTPANASLRNLRITACYAELSRAIAARVGRENVNWCTFATWASRTAGRFIRLAGFDERIRAAMAECFGPASKSSALPPGARQLAGGLGLIEHRIVEGARDLALDTSAQVAAGNLSVFAELAPLFAALISALDASPPDRRQRVSSIIESLKAGPTGQGGQDLLRRAVSDYAEACSINDSRRKAEAVLRANAQVGAHEQIRLQPYIYNAMTASLTDRVSALLRHGAGITSPLSMATLVEARLRPYRLALEQIWLRVATSYLMTLELPNGTLHLGEDLPSPPGQPIFPADLRELQDKELIRILHVYRADGATSHGSGASVWSDLSDRMRYIFELFRSRQQDQSLFTPPFDAEAMTAIERGLVPLLGV